MEMRFLALIQTRFLSYLASSHPAQDDWIARGCYCCSPYFHYHFQMIL